MEEGFKGLEDADGTAALDGLVPIVEKALGAERAASFAEDAKAKGGGGGGGGEGEGDASAMRMSWAEVRDALFE